MAEPGAGHAHRGHRRRRRSGIRPPRLATGLGHRLFLQRAGRWKEWTATTAVGLAAATRLDDRYGQALLLDNYGDALTQLGDFEGAGAYLRRALELHTRMGNRAGIARIEVMLGIMCFRASAPAQAIQHARRAMANYTAIGDAVGEAHVLHFIAWYHIEVGDYPQAVAFGERSVDIHRNTTETRRLAGSLDTLGLAHHLLGNHSVAVRYITESVETFKRVCDRYHIATCLVHLADSQHAAGDNVGARASYAESLAIFEQIGRPDADYPRRRLHELDTAAATRAAGGPAWGDVGGNSLPVHPRIPASRAFARADPHPVRTRHPEDHDRRGPTPHRRPDVGPYSMGLLPR